MSYSRETLTLPRELFSRRLHLREARIDDLDCMWQMDSDPEVMRYIQPEASDRDDHRKMFQDGLDSGRFKFLRMIEWRERAGPLGWAFLRPTEDGDWLELGYRLLPAAWGQGVAPEASLMLMEVAFEDWSADRVMALITPGNAKSNRVVEKLGFDRREETDRYYGESLELWVRDR